MIGCEFLLGLGFSAVHLWGLHSAIHVLWASAGLKIILIEYQSIVAVNISTFIYSWVMPHWIKPCNYTKVYIIIKFFQWDTIDILLAWFLTLLNDFFFFFFLVNGNKCSMISMSSTRWTVSISIFSIHSTSTEVHKIWTAMCNPRKGSAEKPCSFYNSIYESACPTVRVGSKHKPTRRSPWTSHFGSNHKGPK